MTSTPYSWVWNFLPLAYGKQKSGKRDIPCPQLGNGTPDGSGMEICKCIRGVCVCAMGEQALTLEAHFLNQPSVTSRGMRWEWHDPFPRNMARGTFLRSLLVSMQGAVYKDNDIYIVCSMLLISLPPLGNHIPNDQLKINFSLIWLKHRSQSVGVVLRASCVGCNNGHSWCLVKQSIFA